MTGRLKWVRALALAPVFGVGGVSLVAAVAGLFGRASPWLDLFTHFAPFWFLGAVVAVCGGAALARGAARRMLIVVGVLGALSAASRLAPELTRPIRPAVAAGDGSRLRLIQFNAWDDNADPEAAADWIARQAPDVVTVEEASPVLRRAMAARGFSVVNGVVSTAIFSRNLAPRDRFVVPFQDWRRVPDFARARFAIGGGPATFTVVAVHITWPTLASHWPQREAFARLLDDQAHDRLIVAGDFNLTPWSFGLARFDQRLRLERRDRAIATWPAMRLVSGVLVTLPAILPIDHVYAGPEWRTVGIRRGPRLGSDHYPLVIDLVLRG